MHNEKQYDIRILETKPEGGISIIETDLEVDFDPPVGYMEPSWFTENSQGLDTMKSLEPFIVPDSVSTGTFKPYAGSGNKLKDKDTNATPVSISPATSESHSGAVIDKKRTAPAALRLPPGRIFFGYPSNNQL